MSNEIENKLTKEALRLKDLDKAIIKSIAEGQSDRLLALVGEYVSVKKWIKTVLMDIPFSVVKIDNPIAKLILQRININEGLQSDDIVRKVEKGFEDLTGKEVKLTEFSEDEIEEMVSDLFYSWFSPQDYVRDLSEIGSLTLGVSFPKKLEVYVQEARSCYAFQEYNAVYALSRTILETCIREIYLKLHPNKRSKDNVIHMDLWKVNEMIREISKGALKDRLVNIYTKLSNIVHGYKTVSKKEAKETFRDSLKLIHDLYSYHRY